MARPRPRPRPASDPDVRVRGARLHNLRDVDVDIPRDAIVAFTGVSGSGKSSLAYGTIYAEAQRRYFESVSPYARRLLHPGVDPEVDAITGLPPAVAIQQRRAVAGVRSTVGTVTTMSNLLRVLYSRAGTYPKGAPQLAADAFSRNTAAGACPVCHGLGRTRTATGARMVPDPSLTIREGAIAAWPGGWQGRNLRDIVRALGIPVDVPWRELRKRDRDWLLYTDEQPVVLVDPEEDRDEWPYNGTFVSARRHVMTTLTSSTSERMRDRAAAFVESAPCPHCDGTGLRAEARAVRFAGLDIASMSSLALHEVARTLRSASSGPRPDVAARLCSDLVARLDVLCELGLGYLQLGRPTSTLSPGELQRVRIATELRSGLFGVVYVLDEPSAGLHPADSEALLVVLDRLRDAGNSVFVVEHDVDIVRHAEWIVDVGPGAGEAGGRIVYSGPNRGFAAAEGSVTARYVARRRVTDSGREREVERWLRLRGVEGNNLRGIDVDLPLGVLAVVTGVSGAGKSTLVTHLLAPAIAARLGTAGAGDHDDDGEAPRGHIESCEGLEAIDRLVVVDQRPIGRTPRSNLATYTGLFDEVRRRFAATPAARRRGFGPGRFSFNVPGGRCDTCDGDGFVSVELVYLPSTYAPCPTCGGARFNPDTLAVRWRGLDIAEVLALTVDDAATVFADVPRVARALDTLRSVGVGYLRLGQPATELSGGEAQRIKLAAELQRARRGHTLHLLDEPTTGLHPADVEVLVMQLQRLVDGGDSVIVVEHDMDVVAVADWVVELGPGGGDGGGTVVATGRPLDVARNEHSPSAPYLAARLATAARRRGGRGARPAARSGR